MINYKRLCGFAIVCLFLILSTSCADLMKIQRMSAEIASGEPYPDDDPTKDPKLKPFVEGSVQMGIPAGWKSVPVSESGNLKFKFVKDDGSRLLVFCYGTFVSRDNLAGILQTAALKAMPNAVKTAGMWELEVPSLNPRFELYKGSVEAEGIDVPMDVNIAWRINNRLGGCKYGLVYTAASKKNKENEYEFLSIVRSLR
jgi:hypothetical protein